MIRLYSPRQILIATFLSGPLATAYLLKKSFESIGKKELANKSLLVCLIGTAVILAILPFLPENTPSIVIPLAYLIPLTPLLQKHYLTKQEIDESEEYTFESNWKATGVSLLACIIFAALAFGAMMIAETDDDIAQYFVEDVNNTNLELNNDFYIGLEALKDPSGSGAFLNITINNDVIDIYKEASQDELKAVALSFIGDDYLTTLADNNVYVIVNFQTSNNEMVNKVILLATNIKPNE